MCRCGLTRAPRSASTASSTPGILRLVRGRGLRYCGAVARKLAPATATGGVLWPRSSPPVRDEAVIFGRGRPGPRGPTRLKATPNQALQRTPVAVTVLRGRDARVAPAAAELGRSAGRGEAVAGEIGGSPRQRLAGPPAVRYPEMGTIRGRQGDGRWSGRRSRRRSGRSRPGRRSGRSPWPWWTGSGTRWTGRTCSPSGRRGGAARAGQRAGVLRPRGRQPGHRRPVGPRCRGHLSGRRTKRCSRPAGRDGFCEF